MDNRKDPGITSVMANVRAFLAASNWVTYSPEDLAEIIYYTPATVAEAMHRLGILDRRELERRSAPRADSPESRDRRAKERRSFWGSYF